jgi:hypothetical protein
MAALSQQRAHTRALLLVSDISQQRAHVHDDPEGRALAQPRHDGTARTRRTPHRPAWHITRVRTHRTCVHTIVAPQLLQRLGSSECFVVDGVCHE